MIKNTSEGLGEIYFSDGKYHDDGKRPKFESWVSAEFPTTGFYEGAARCHYMSFYLIQDVLIKALNQYALKGKKEIFKSIIREFPGVLAARDDCDEVYKEYEDAMESAVENVLGSIEKYGTADFVQETFVKNMNKYLSCLNSCPYNLRFPQETTGDSGNQWNSSIQENYDPGEWGCFFDGQEISSWAGLEPGVPMNVDLSQVEIRLSNLDGMKIRAMDDFCEQYKIKTSVKLATAYAKENGRKYPFVYSSSNLFSLPKNCSSFRVKGRK